MSQEGGAPPLSLSAAGSALNSGSLLQFIRQGKSFSGHEAHCCFLNTGGTRFANVSAASGLDFKDDGRAVGIVDWDLDGDLDLWISNRNGPQLRFLRNGLADHGESVSFRLRGTRCNRDAIGARVEVVVRGEDRKRVKTLRAGDGYLAQSSKWLHFGLGKEEHISHVIVNWPGGDREVFSTVTVGKQYDLVQDSGTATAWDPPRVTSLARSAALAPESGEAVHAFSISRVPVPRLPYRTLDGTNGEAFPPRFEKPVLLNLWASWCAPCKRELAELAAGREQLQSVGVDVVALSVDGLDGNQTVSDQDLAEFLRQLDFPFRAGRASAGLVEKIQLLNNFLFDLHIPLPVPSSLLIDSEGRAAALYKGEVAIERVLADVAALDEAPSLQRSRTTPFSGRWYESPKTPTLVPMLDALTANGFLLEADDYVRRIGTAGKNELLPAIARLGIALYRGGMNENAQKHFEVIRKIDPTFVEVQTTLGKLYEEQGQVDAAVELYREAIRRNANDIGGLNNLAWLLATCPTESIRNGAEAVQFTEKANELTRNSDPNILDTLAAAYAQAGDFEAARRTARRALALARSRGRLALVSRIGPRLDLYKQGEPFIEAQE